MRLAFYAPLKAPDHAVASGDRQMAQLLYRGLQLAGHEVFVASRLRSFDGVGDTVRQGRIARRAQDLALQQMAEWQREPQSSPQLWFTYHLYHKAPDWLGPTIATQLSIPYIIAEASWAPKQEAGRWALGHRAVAAALRRADAVIGLNPADRACVLQTLSHAGLYHQMAPFLDAGRYPSAKMMSHPPRLITVAMMRAGDKLASYRLLGQALARVLDQEWMLDVVGDGPARPDVENALAMLGDRVRFLGALSQEMVAAALAEADMMIWPAINEAYGMALLEAQACGLPVVAGASGGVPSIVTHGETGLLSPPGDDDALGASTRRLLTDRSLRVSMGQAARDQVRRRHDLPAAAERLGKIIKDLLPAQVA